MPSIPSPISSHPLRDALGEARPVFVYAAVFGSVINLLLLAIPLYSLQVLDRVLSTGSMETLFWLTLVMLVIFVFSSLLHFARALALTRAGEWLDRRMSAPLVSYALGVAILTGKSAGSQSMRDLQALKVFLTGQGLITLFDAPWSLMYLLAVLMIHGALGAVVFLGCVLLLALAWLNEAAVRKPIEEASEHSVKAMSRLDSALRNAEVIEAMGMTHAVLGSWEEDSATLTRLQAKASDRASVIQSVTRFIRLALQAAVIGIGGYLAVRGQLTGGGMIASSILAARAFAPFETAIATWKSTVEARKSYHRLSAALAGLPPRGESISLPIPQGYLALERVVFAPGGAARPVLKGVSFALQPGEILGIAGPSAAGKSTLAKLIMGIWKPLSGTVRLDHADVYEWNRQEFGRHVGYLPQDVELFAGTVRENIARMQREVEDREIVRAAQIAGAHPMILSLPHGYETDIGPQGAVLSAGQRQRIGLARAFFGNPRLLVLDEPNANLDFEGEHALAFAMQNAKKLRITTLIISHRMNILSHVDKLMVLRDGMVEHFGPPQEVLEKLKRAASSPPLPTEPQERMQ